MSKARTEAETPVVGNLRPDRRKPILIIIAIVAVLLIGAVVAWSMREPYVKPTTKETKQAYQGVETKSEELAGKKDYNQAVDEWEKYLDQYPDGPQAFDAHMYAASLRQTNNDPEGALRHYKEAERIKPESVAYLEAMAKIYASKGDKENAIKYYTKYRDNFPKDYPARDSEIEWLNNKIKKLEQS